MESRAKRQLNYLWAIKTTDIIQLSSTSYSHRTPSAFQHFATTNRNPLNEYVNNNINSIPRFLFFIKSSVTIKGCNVRPFRLPAERHSTPISCWSFSAFSRRFSDKILVRKLTFVARHQINAKKQRHLHIFGIITRNNFDFRQIPTNLHLPSSCFYQCWNPYQNQRFC